MAQWLWNRFWKSGARQQFSREQVDDARIRGQLLNQLAQRYKPLFANRAMRLFQVMGIGFNLGALLCVLVLLAVTDRAFGWQSSLTTSAETVHGLVSTLALPWSWLWGEGTGWPSLQQILNTQIRLGQGGQDFAAADFRVWWPFMLLCVLVYGLLPRLLVWAITWLREGRLLDALTFDGYHDQALWRRMHSVAFSSQSLPSDHQGEAATVQTPLQQISASESHLFVLADTLKRYPTAGLQAWLSQSTGAVSEVQPIERLADLASNHSCWLILEGWQPPIEETLQQLKQLADGLIRQQADLHLLLLGKPLPPGSDSDGNTSERPGKPLSARQAEVWRKKLDLLQCANILLHADVDAATAGEHL
nr:DUF2868 domain-containing protein [Oceanobacter mangrovi]